MKYKRGDVILVLFPNSDLITYKKRPALVVQGDGISSGLPQKIVAMITSNTERTGPTRLMVSKNDPAGKAMGLRSDSVVVTDNLTTVREREIYTSIGHCPDMPLVDKALKHTLGLF